MIDGLPLRTTYNSLRKPCAAEGCSKLSGKRKRYCSGHHARSQRGQSLATPLRSKYETPFARVEAAAYDLGFVSADDDRGYEAARARLRKAVEAAAFARCFRLRHTPDVVALPLETPALATAEV